MSNPTSKTVIPGWMSCSEKDDRGEELTPLERFVLDNEPAGTAEEIAFLAGLAAVLKPLNDEIARLHSMMRGKTFVTPYETPAKPARDADHCDFPDCEQHWTLVVEQLVTQCEAYHSALDTMFARMIEKTSGEQPHCFFPTESGQPWEACQSGHALIQSVRSAQKTGAPQ